MAEPFAGFGQPRKLVSTRKASNFARLATLSPDGSTALTQNEDCTLSLFDLPSAEATVGEEEWTPRLQIPSSGPVTSTCWYPGARKDDAASMCFVRATRDHPIHLVDATTGKTRASYPIEDHVERFVSPHSMTFSADGTRLFCGFDSAIEVFDVSAPGSEGSRNPTRPTRKSKDGQGGIISALSVSATQPDLLATGTFTGSIGLYSITDSSLDPVLTFPSASPNGITQVRFHPTRPLLFSVGRRSDIIVCWDVRQSASVLHTFERPGDTNQRIAFDVDPWGRWLTTGDTEGNVRVYDAQTCDTTPMAVWKLHDDSVPSAAFHPWQPILMTCSGSRSASSPTRRLRRPSSVDSSESDSSSDDEAPPPSPAGQLALWTFDPAASSS